MRSVACSALALAVVVGPRVAIHVVAASLALVAGRADFTSLVGALHGVALELLACSPLYQLLCCSVLDDLLLLLVVGGVGVGPSGRGLDRCGSSGGLGGGGGGGGGGAGASRRRGPLRGRRSRRRLGGGNRRGRGDGGGGGGGSWGRRRLGFRGLLVADGRSIGSVELPRVSHLGRGGGPH